ncbi:DUF397 domain-containing protein [Actinomadura napierensis]|uniref:DUF397 domain-containing protein n=1 Tax=Actinomadura napierensis TaxID=267854 RepID=A0ABN2Z6G8_9ACTN
MSAGAIFDRVRITMKRQDGSMIERYVHWHKSSYSEANGACLEISRSVSGTIGVRDSKQHSAGPILDFTAREWTAFLKTIRSTTV